ncbi:restriction endonuclease subunit S [Roseibium sp. FZY0029]|uniref:restriction endonuclease subunit S n=1 Tax=Roseibium sp. FZY0029 TaxID=3116647 RepID=UPI002EAA0B96|nr:restriction endonuclease subunit S [Roseibium sp. FZY0029]
MAARVAEILIPGRAGLSVNSPATDAPSQWEWVAMNTVATQETGHTPSRSHPEWWGGHVPWISIRDARINHGKIIYETIERTNELGLENSSARLLPKGTVCLSRTASVGYVTVMGKPMATSQDFVTWTCSEALLPWFLVYALLAEGDGIRKFGKGTTHTTIYLPEIRALHICLPPVPEQKRIVAKLDALSARSARARKDLARIDTLVTRYKQAVLRSAYQGKLTANWRDKVGTHEDAAALVDRTPEPKQPRGGRVATDSIVQGKAALAVNKPNVSPPVGWAWVPLNRVARQETGHTPSRSHPEWWGGDIPWIGIKDAGLHHGKTINDTLQKTNEDGLANSSARLLPAGTVCLSRTASVGYVTLMGRPMATSQDFVTWTCTEALVPKFLMYALMAEGDDIRVFGKGTTHTTIYFPEVRAFHLCLAPLEEQKEIVRRIESAFQKIDRLAAEAKRALELTDKLDEAILAKAFRGELVPQDPNDEPASVLLERIKAERVAAPKAKRGRGARAPA